MSYDATVCSFRCTICSFRCHFAPSRQDDGFRHAWLGVETLQGDLMRTFCFFIMAAMLMAMGPLFATGIELFNQPYYLGGSAYTSAWDPSVPVDYEVADNFSAVNMPFNKFVFYGVTANWDDNWFPSPPAAVEPFKIKFYQYVDGWTEPQPGIIAPTTGTYTIRMYDDWGDGWDS